MSAAQPLQTPALNGGPIVVIGGGVVGLSVAYHLAARGYRAVTVVEQHTLASGTTAKGTGGIRQQFSSAINIALSRRAVDYFAAFAERVGETIPYRRHGYLFLLNSPDQLAVFRANAVAQRAVGVPTEILDAADIHRINPSVRTEGLIGASYCPTDGSSRGPDVAVAFARRAAEMGVRILEHTTVVDIRHDGNGAITGVETTAGTLPAEVVVNAAGPWAAEIGRLAGVDLPIEPRRRQAFLTQPLPWLTDDLPVTIDFGTGAYLHPGFDGPVIGGNDRNVAAGFDEVVDWSLVPPLLDALTHRFPAMRDVVIARGWAGVRDMTPDDHAIVGPVTAVPGFWMAAGFSGHGFMHAPVIGELLAAWLLDGTPSLDLAPLRLERFAQAAMVTETTVF